MFIFISLKNLKWLAPLHHSYYHQAEGRKIYCAVAILRFLIPLEHTETRIANFLKIYYQTQYYDPA
jgi:hypothetical protein